VIITKQLSKTFKTKEADIHAVKKLDLDIKSGQIVGLFGPNGAGKTTSVRMLSTVFKPTFGGGIVGGYDILEEPMKVRSVIGVAPEIPGLYPRLSARRNLKFYADLYKIPKYTQDNIIYKLMKEFDLHDSIDRAVGGFSKGMRQKLSIIKSIMHEPQVLILDEPWAGLSPDASRDLRAIIRRLSEDRTILISTHNLAQAEMLVDRFIIIANGEKIVDNTKAEMTKKYEINPKVSIVTMKPFEFNKLDSSLDYVKQVEVDKNSADIEINTIDDIPDLIAHMVKEGARIRTVKESIPSLEDIYIHLIEENGGN
jgi:ABC-2 type transport system ATP-binding protein